MKSSFSPHGDELDILLEHEEVELLNKKTLVATAKRLEGEVMVFLRKAKFSSDSRNECVEEYLLPLGSNFDNVKAFLIEVSPFGYEQLLERGATGDGIGISSPCRVEIYDKLKTDRY